MTESEMTEPKGKYFKAVIAARDYGRHNKKSTPRTLPTLQPRQCHLPKDHSSSIPEGDAGVPTGAAAVTSHVERALPNGIIQSSEGTGAASRCAERVRDEVTNVSKLLFDRNFTGFLKRSEQIEDDMVIIQTISSANDGSHVQLVTEDALRASAAQTELLPAGESQPGSICSAQSDPTQLDQPYSQLSVRGKQHTFPRLAKVKRKYDAVKNSKRMERKTVGGHQRAVKGSPMRLPKVTPLPGQARKTDGCRSEGSLHSEMVCCGTTNLKRPRGVCKSLRSTKADTKPDTFVSYPCPSNLTIIQQQGCHTSTRACSPMPSPRKPLPPIRRRHHSDICTVCPEVHDWKGLARNPRWYSHQPSGQCSCETRTENIDDQVNHCGASSQKEVAHKETVYREDGEGDVGARDEEEAVDEARNNDEDGGDSWYPESSIPVQVINNEGISDETKDEDGTQLITGCDAVRNAHCPWLVEASSRDQQDGSEEHQLNIGSQPTSESDRLQAMLMERMNFECENKTECEFEDDSTLLRAVLLRNHTLNQGDLSNSGETGSSEVESQDVERSDKETESTCMRERKNSGGCNMLLNFCNRLLQKNSNSTHLLNGHIQRSDMSLTPNEAVIMTSRGQQKVVNSSLIAVGIGHGENKAKHDEKEINGPDFGVGDDSDEALLRQEMKRYLHSLHHDNAKKQHHHGLSSAQNITMSVQNLTAARSITADMTNNSRLTEQVAKAVGFIPILTKDGSICKKTGSPSSRFPRAAMLPPIASYPSEMLLMKRFDGEVKGMQLPQRQGRKNKK